MKQDDLLNVIRTAMQIGPINQVDKEIRMAIRDHLAIIFQNHILGIKLKRDLNEYELNLLMDLWNDITGEKL